MELQTWLWKIHTWPLFVGGFFVHDNLHVDFMNPQMFQCIICRFQQAFGNNLNQSSIAKKCFIKYNKTNGINLMKTCW